VLARSGFTAWEDGWLVPVLTCRSARGQPEVNRRRPEILWVCQLAGV